MQRGTHPEHEASRLTEEIDCEIVGVLVEAIIGTRGRTIAVKLPFRAVRSGIRKEVIVQTVTGPFEKFLGRNGKQGGENRGNRNPHGLAAMTLQEWLGRGNRRILGSVNIAGDGAADGSPDVNLVCMNLNSGTRGRIGNR